MFQSVWKRGSPRRPNETLTLTAKGRKLLDHGRRGRGNLGPDTVAYELRYYCAGVTTYRVEDDAMFLEAQEIEFLWVKIRSDACALALFQWKSGSFEKLDWRSDLGKMYP